MGHFIAKRLAEMQQVNLYVSELRPSTHWLTLHVLVAVTFISFILMGIFYFFSVAQQAKLRAEIEIMEAQQAATSQGVAKLQSSVRPINSAQLDARMAELKAHITYRLALGQVIEGQNLGNERGYSESLLAMARHSFPSLSLQHIRFSHGAALSEFSGVCRISDDVPNYIRTLQNQESFSATQFGLLSIMSLESTASEKRASGDLHEFSVGFDDVFTQYASKEKP